MSTRTFSSEHPLADPTATGRHLISVLAPNRIGLLACVTHALDELGAELLGIDQAILHGDASLTFEAQLPESLSADVVRQHLEDATRSFAASVMIRPCAEVDEFDVESETLTLDFYGDDRPGMIRQLSSHFATEGIDIREVSANRHQDDSFSLRMTIELPEGIDRDELQDDIFDWANRIGVISQPTERWFLPASELSNPLPVGSLLNE